MSKAAYLVRRYVRRLMLSSKGALDRRKLTAATVPYRVGKFSPILPQQLSVLVALANFPPLQLSR